ncbi:uncharacterized protein LOC110931834 [Helianthus annuus]|uniref:uncharacterized protein LOC110931834 n=1 Tax=Helianthus annuus TaxID=4232 RepID=UPI000B90041C|nr:uncharacterized protein LOC110931834 [Helianthus annuus]
MGSLAAWNIRGLNRPLKQKEVRQVMKDNHLQVFAIMETHVDASNVSSVCKKVCRSWSWATNSGCCQKGTRIMVGWDADVVDVMVLTQSDQVMHTQIIFKMDRKTVFCSFVYADNHYKNRRKPWVIMGDFNSSLYLEDSLTSSSTSSVGMREFKECVNNIEVFDINSSGLHYTWSNKQKQGAVFKKIDRVMGNTLFIDVFPAAAACYHPYRISDHSPCILTLPSVTREKPKPFKFVNLLSEKKGFIEEVKRTWDVDVQGFPMYQVVQKLKALKRPLRKLFQQQGNLHEKVKEARNNLDVCQRAMDEAPMNLELKTQHADFIKRIFPIRDANGNLFEGGAVSPVMVDHYTRFFGSSGAISIDPSPDLFSNVLSVDKACGMVRDVTDEEIKGAMFSIAGNKAPGPDGFTSVFFKRSWDIVGDDVCRAVKDFFRNGLGDIVSINQSAFVPGRKISDNILLTQELMHNYHRNVGPPRCAFKVDIQKAYDTVDWNFLQKILVGFGFHEKMVKWEMACVASTSFSVAINGNLYGFFKGRRGL